MYQQVLGVCSVRDTPAPPCLCRDQLPDRIMVFLKDTGGKPNG